MFPISNAGIIQMQCSPSFDCNWDKQNDPTVCQNQLHHSQDLTILSMALHTRFRVLQQVNVTATHQIAWAGSLNPQIAWAAREHSPIQTPINGRKGTTPFKISPVLVIQEKRRPKTHHLFQPFSWLIADTNYKHLECLAMPGTHSEQRWSQMPHISALRVGWLCIKWHLVISNCWSRNKTETQLFHGNKFVFVLKLLQQPLKCIFEKKIMISLILQICHLTVLYFKDDLWSCTCSRYYQR